MDRPLHESLTVNPFRDKVLCDASGRPIRGKEVFIGVEGTGEKRQLIYLNEKELSTHLLLLGTTGIGKTVFLTNLVCQFIRCGWPIFAFDFKGDPGLLKAAYITACLCGRKDDFMLFNPSAASTNEGWAAELGSCSYNPCVSIKSPADLTNAELRASMGKSAKANEYYSDVKEDLISNMNNAMFGTGKPSSHRDKYIALTNQDAMQKLIDETSDIDAKVFWQNILEVWRRKPEDYNKNTKGTQMFYSRFGLGPYKSLLNSYTSDITAVEAYANNRIVWNILPSMSMTNDARALAKLMLSDVLTLAGRIQLATEQKKPCLILIDEARHAVFESFADALAMGRGAGFWVTMGLQSISQIDQETSPEFRRELLTNFRSIAVMSTGNDADTAEEFSRMFGEHEMKTNQRYGEMSMTDTDSRKVTTTDILSMTDFQVQIRTPRKEHKGHIVGLFNPDQFELGTDCPFPRFDATTTRQHGLRLFERVAGEE